MRNKGFTLVELLVTISIVSVLSIVVFANYRTGQKQFSLQRSAHKLSQDIRGVQNMAMSAKEFQGTVPSGYGVYLTTAQPGQYILFADLDGDKNYDANEMVETLEFEEGIFINSLSPGNPLTVFFSPPDPTITIFPDASSALISLNFTGGSEKIIRINKAGLIGVE
jgi:prepilin-type N-terminal cleavage/methylation domain-containing protein